MSSLFNRVVHSQEPRNEINNDRKRPAKPDYHSPNKKTKFNVRRLTGNPRDFTITSDEVHQSIDVCPVMKALIDTEQFQRLRHIKQLGVTNLVYSCADHNRFQHSVGVSYLAREMCTRIKNKQRNLNTTDKDVLCVTLAGLLHDIGHGPYSHIFEAFRGSLHSQMKKDAALMKHYDENFPSVPKNWSHEHSSLLMIDAALESLGLQIDMDNLDRPLKQIGDGIDAYSMRVFKHDGRSDYSGDDNVLTSRDFIFIKECIFGKPIPQVVEKFGNDDLMIGRLDPQKEWLYDLVANRHNGLDVDKMDYFARDERRSLAGAGKINLQILYNALVAKASCSRLDCKKCSAGGKHFMICYPKKCVEEVMNFFRFRFKMHGTVYQHKTSSAAAAMVVDILMKADPYHVIIAGGEQHSISSAVINQEAFLTLKDTIIEDIYNSTSRNLQPARDLTKRFLARDLYSKSKLKIGRYYPCYHPHPVFIYF
jgi:HD superfamily phosphohydrolase